MTPLERAKDAVLRARYPTVDFDSQRDPEMLRVVHEIGRTDEIARAVLLAIREPSEGMEDAGSRVWTIGDYNRDTGESRLMRRDEDEPHLLGIDAVWTAMIDAALSEGG